MSKQELDRLSVIEQVQAKYISQKQGAKQLGISPRQFRRLQKDYKNQGASGLISGKRGAPSNHKYSEAHKNKVLAAIQKNYRGFGPKLVSECLQERQDIKVSIETVRQWMIEDGLWTAKGKKRSSAHQQRERRSFFGELIQIDGSYHDWFEGRSEKCCLLVAIDDASSSILWLRFCKAETTQDYFAFMEQYFSIYGLPQSLYTDKHGVFRVNHPGAEETNLTQFSRAMEELGVELIHASTPQAKGRVERANKTLQDRLIKLMRLENISSIEEANAYLPEFIEKHNAKFAITPSKLGNAHCAIDDIAKLKQVLSVHTEKKLSKSLEFQYDNRLYQVQAQHTYRLQNQKVTLHEHHSGLKTIYHKEKALDFKVKAINKKTPEVHDRKTLQAKLDTENLANLETKQTEIGSVEPWMDYKRIEWQMAVS